MREERLQGIQRALAAEGVDGWLLYDFRGSDPISRTVLGLADGPPTTRRWYCLLPAAGPPRGLVSAVEPHVLGAVDARPIVYRSAEEHRAGLAALLRGRRRLAMQYSPENEVPYVSRVDAGTLELVRALGVEVVSAGDLIQEFEATWTPAQRASHERAAAALHEIVAATFRRLGAAGAGAPSEVEVQGWLLEALAGRGLVTAKPPIVAVDAHSADPHFDTAAETALPVAPGAFLLVDIWAKEPGGVYADITWTAQRSERAGDEIEAVFQIVRRARDAAFTLVRARIRAGEPIAGWEADAAARQVIADAGYGDLFVHRTGHSIGAEVHGNGANLDGFETRDSRRLLPHTCFSIEPGIYLPGRFGVRSEIDVYLEDDDAVITGGPAQTEVIPLLRSPA